MNALITAWIAAFGLLLVAPLAQMKWPLVPEKPLHGVTVPAERPQAGVRSWFEGDFQKQFDNWFSQNIGFRPTLVRTDNQLGLSLFHEVTAHTDDDVILGLENVLYQKSGLDAYNRLDRVPEEQLDETARKIRKLQDGLAGRGIAFVLVVTPSKAEVYPEYIPPSRVLKHRQAEKTNYQAMAPRLRAHGVNLVDAHELFAVAKVAQPYRLFPPGGIHWSLYSAGLVTQALVETLEAIMGKDLVNIRCESVRESDKPRSDQFETDLADLMNVWRFRTADWKYPRPKFARRETGEEYRPNMLIVGDSFSTAFPWIMGQEGVYASLDFYWYYGTKKSLPAGTETPIDRDHLDFEQEVFSKDAIVLEIAEFMIDRVGWGFIDDALAALEKSGGRAGL